MKSGLSMHNGIETCYRCKMRSERGFTFFFSSFSIKWFDQWVPSSASALPWSTLVFDSSLPPLLRLDVYSWRRKSSWLSNICLFAVHMTFIGIHAYVTGLCEHVSRGTPRTSSRLTSLIYLHMGWRAKIIRQKSKQLEITVMRGLFMAFSRRIQLIIVNERLQPPESIARKEKNAKLARFAKRKKKSIQNQHIHGNKIVWNAIEKIYSQKWQKQREMASHWKSKFRSKLSPRLRRTASARPLRHVFECNMGLFGARLVSSPNCRGVFFWSVYYCWRFDAREIFRPSRLLASRYTMYA